MLRAYFRSREVVRKALGTQLHIINPKRCLCPFISKKKRSLCGEKYRGTRELNRLNDLSNFITHLKKDHETNPSAGIAAARLSKVDSFLKIGPELLDRECKTITWELNERDVENGHEEIRKPHDFSDRFDPLFELETDEHHEWVRKAKAEFDE